MNLPVYPRNFRVRHRRNAAGPTAPRRVLYLQPTIEFGGAERQASLVLPLLADHGFEATLVMGPGDGLARWLSRRGFERFHRSQHFPGPEPFSLLRLCGIFSQLERLLDELDGLHARTPFDVVVGSLGFGWAAAGLCARRWGVPSVWRAGGITLGSTSDRQSPEGLALRLLGKLLPPELLVCNAEAVARYFGPLVPAPTRVVLNGVELPAQPARPRPDRLFTVGFAGRLAPEKNLPLLFEAIARARAEGAPMRALVRGSGPCEPLLARLRALGLTDVVELEPGRDPYEEFFSHCDAIALASDAEGCSNLALEAMAHGLPVVATGVGGTPEIVRDRVDGLLVPPRRADLLGDALAALAASPAWRLRLGQNARRQAMRLSPERCAGNIARALQWVIETSTAEARRRAA